MLIRLASIRVFEEVFDHADEHEEKEWGCIRGISARNRYRLDHLQGAYEDVVDIGTLRQLVKQVVGNKVETCVLGGADPVRQKARIGRLICCHSRFRVNLPIPPDGELPGIGVVFIVTEVPLLFKSTHAVKAISLYVEVLEFFAANIIQMRRAFLKCVMVRVLLDLWVGINLLLLEWLTFSRSLLLRA